MNWDKPIEECLRNHWMKNTPVDVTLDDLRKAALAFREHALTHAGTFDIAPIDMHPSQAAEFIGVPAKFLCECLARAGERGMKVESIRRAYRRHKARKKGRVK